MTYYYHEDDSDEPIDIGFKGPFFEIVQSPTTTGDPEEEHDKDVEEDDT